MSRPEWIKAASEELAAGWDCAQFVDDRIARSAEPMAEIIAKHAPTWQSLYVNAESYNEHVRELVEAAREALTIREAVHDSYRHTHISAKRVSADDRSMADEHESLAQNAENRLRRALEPFSTSVHK